MALQSRILIYALHPIYYQVPIFREMQKSLLDRDLPPPVVAFGSDVSMKEIYFDELNTTFKSYQKGILSGYEYVFLRNRSPFKSGFFHRISLDFLYLVLKNRKSPVLLHGYDSLAAWVTVYLCFLFNRNLVWRGEVTPRVSEGPIARLKYFFLKSFFFSLVRHAVYSCSGNRAFLKRVGFSEDQMTFAPCAVDNKLQKEKRRIFFDDTEAFKRELGLKADRFTLIFCARMTSRKNPALLIEAISRGDLISRVQVLFVGDGPELASVRKLAEDKGVFALFVGMQDPSEVHKYYMVSDAAIILSEYDPSPKVLNEALNFGLPIICTSPVGTASDLVIDGLTGFIAKSFEPSEIAKLISEVSRRSTEGFDWDSHAKMALEGWDVSDTASGILTAFECMEAY